MGFGMVENQGVTYLASDILEGIQGVRHGFSTRVGGVSPEPWSSMNMGFGSGDMTTRVLENWRRFTWAIGVAGRPLVYLKQVHSARAVAVEDAPPEVFHCAGEGDALYTARAGVLLAAISADCVPILAIVGSPARCVAAIHAGWRGVASGIAGRTLEEMSRLAGVEPSTGDIWAAIGPHLRSCCFEVGPDVVGRFRAAGPLEPSDVRAGQGDRAHVDLANILVRQLIGFGVLPDRIDVMRHCTKCRADLFFSHRRDGSGHGMLGAAVCLEP